MTDANIAQGLLLQPARKTRADLAQAWLHELPNRWAATGAAAGLMFSVAVLLGPTRPIGIAPAVAIALVVTVLAGLNWLLLRYWAMWSLKSRFEISPHAALVAIRDNWLSGAAILAGAPIILRRAAIEFGLYPYVSPTEFDDFIAAITAFPVMMFGAYLLSIISRSALARRIQ